MSAPDEEADELLTAYRRASDAQAGRPAPATRAAIHAESRAALQSSADASMQPEARATAARRIPAANDSRFFWRVAASLAVVGVALLVWRQLPRIAMAPLEEPRTPAMELPQEPAVTGAGATADATSAKTSADAAPSTLEGPAAPAAARLNSPGPAQQQGAVSAAAPAPPPVIVNLDVRQALPEASIEVPAPRASNGLRETAAQSKPLPGVDAIVRREFPALLGAATPPAGVWIVQDARGRTIRTGTLARGESLGVVMTRLQRELPDRRLRPFEIANLRTTRGATVLVGISRAE